MKFDELDKRMRQYETAHDHCVLPGIYMVARLDGRGFTTLTKKEENFEAPFDVRFRDTMVETVKHLMDCGFKVLYGYSESDEISLLFHPDEATFSRKERKYNSVLAGEASSKFALTLGRHAVFDCRISQLPQRKDVIDYFRWRNEDAHRNALNAHCYWMLRKKQGLSANRATKQLMNLTVADKNELLFTNGINFNNLPGWQKRGFGVFWENYEKEGFNPKENITVKTMRKRLKVELELPMKDEYSSFIKSFLNSTLDNGEVEK